MVSVELRPVPTLGGSATLGDLRGMCAGRSARETIALVEAWVTDQVASGSTDAEAIAQAVTPILLPHGLEISLRIVP